jgi:DNA-binding transcriptional regulator GbsR (MarR family)
MEIESLFTGTKWTILTYLSQSSYSPLELAEKLNTTIANISQQLRLLEAYGIVKSVKVPNVEKGKPRIQYSLSNDLAYLIFTFNKATDKKLIKPTPQVKLILKIIFYEDEKKQELLFDLFSHLKSHLASIKLLALNQASKDFEVIVVCKNYSEIESKLKDLKKEDVKFKFYTYEQFEKLKLSSDLIYSLHDPDGLIAQKEKEVAS